MKHSRWVRIIILTFVLIGVCATFSMAASDDKKPLVKSIQFDKTHYEYGDPITVTMDIEATEAGVKHVNVVLMRRINATSGGTSCALEKDFDSPIYSGTYTFTFEHPSTVSDPFPKGSYYVDHIFIDDTAENVSSYSSAGSSEENIKIFKTDRGDICEIIGGSELTVGDFEYDDIKVESFRFEAETLNKGDKVPVSLHLSGGKAGEEYTAYLALFNCYDENPYTVSFKYADDVSLSFQMKGMGFGTHGLSYLSIKKSSSEDYKKYVFDGKSMLSFSTDDQCQVYGNNYIYVNSSSPDEKCPELLSVEISPGPITKPGYIQGKLTFDVPYTNIRQLDIIFEGKDTDSSRGHFEIKPSAQGRFTIPVGTSAQTGDYYLSHITIYDKYGNDWRIQSNTYSADGYCPDIAKDGRQHFRVQNENGENIDCYPEFTGAKYVTVLDEFNIAFRSRLNDSELISEVKALKDGEAGKVEINGDFIAPSALFEAIAGRDVTIMFTNNDYQLIFNGMDITTPRDLDLHMNIMRVEGEEYTSKGHALLISFAGDGDLPGKANIRIQSEFARQMEYMYYFNSESSKIELEKDSAFTKYFDDYVSWCKFDTTHNSDFLLTAYELKDPTMPLPMNSTFSAGKFTYRVIVGRQAALVKANNKKTLKTATIPDKVKYNGVSYRVCEIDANAFSKCKKLSKVTIGKNVEKLGKQAFYSCPKLKDIKIKSTMLKKSRVGSNAFGRINSKAVVKVPKKWLKRYTSMLKARGLTKKSQKIKKY